MLLLINLLCDPALCHNLGALRQVLPNAQVHRCLKHLKTNVAEHSDIPGLAQLFHKAAVATNSWEYATVIALAMIVRVHCSLTAFGVHCAATTPRWTPSSIWMKGCTTGFRKLVSTNGQLFTCQKG